MIHTLLLPALVGVGLVATAQQPGDPVAVIKLLHEGLAKVARQGSEVDRKQVRARLQPLVERSYELRLGAAAGVLEDAQRRRLRGTLAVLLAARHAAYVADAPELSFAPAAAKPLAGDQAVVESSRIEPGGKATPLRYLLHHDDGGWRITSELENGVDPLASLRATLAALRAKEEADAARRRLQERTAAYGASPSEVIRHLQQRLLATMKQAHELGYAGRFERLAPVIAETHDLPFIARYTVRRSWKGLPGPQRQRFLATFEELSVASYAARFDGYAGETFEVLEEQNAKRGYRLVRTQITKSDGGHVSLIYQMHRIDRRWLIVNVLADGVSDLATKRSEYRSIIKREGFAALIDKLEDHIRRFREESDK